MPSSAERLGKGHPFLPAGWGPQSRSDVPWNAPQLEDVNPAINVNRRLIDRFGGSGATGRPSAGGDGTNGGDGIDGAAGIAGADGLGISGGVGASGLNGSVAGRIAGIYSLLAANGITFAALAAGTSLLQRIGNITGEGICNDDGTITITLTIPD
jgi:hypothetical protein